MSFIKGMLATNFDIEMVYIDGLSRLLDCNVNELAELYNGLDDIARETQRRFYYYRKRSKRRFARFRNETYKIEYL